MKPSYLTALAVIGLIPGMWCGDQLNFTLAGWCIGMICTEMFLMAPLVENTNAQSAAAIALADRAEQIIDYCELLKTEYEVIQ